jgi:hypothetical protein
MSAIDLETMSWMLTFTIPVRHNINNWYAVRYQFLDEVIQRMYPLFFFQHLRAVP